MDEVMAAFLRSVEFIGEFRDEKIRFIDRQNYC